MSNLSHETQSRLPHRRRLRLPLIAASVVALLLTSGYLLLPASVHFRILHDEASFNRFMSNQVRAAATLEEIKESLGDGIVVTEQERQRLLAAIQDFCRQSPESYPDGINADDQFVGYDFGGHTAYLQFRDRVLVNFNPREYDEQFEFAAIHP